MDDREFLDVLFQLYARTTGSENAYWRTESTDDGFAVFAVEPDDTRTLIASGMSEVDADWVAGMHGCLSDLVLRLHQALDAEESADRGRDERESKIAELELALRGSRVS